jgi:hypothetical protein
MAKRNGKAGAPVYVDVVVVTCGCGFFPLEKAMHRTSQQAWEAASAHVSLNPTKCDKLVRMYKDTVPAALAPKD